MLHRKKHTNQLAKQLLLLLIITTGITLKGVSQSSISGPTCVTTGTVYSYTLSSYASSFYYNISGGSVTPGGATGGSHALGTLTLQIIWTSSGSISLSASPNAFLSVNTTTAVTGGSITAGQTQSINYNTIPATISCAVASGGACSGANYTYQWQSSANNITYTNISGATAQNLSFSAALTSTTYYRRLVTETVSGTSAYSNVATITVYPALVAGSVNPGSQIINYNTNAAQLSSSGVSGGTNSYSYQWQTGATTSTFNNIGGANATTYTPLSLTSLAYFRVAVTSNGVTAYSNYAVVNVNPPVMPGVISPAYVTITSGTSPGAFTGPPATGGGCGGSYTYQWQSSTNGTSFSTIAGATTQNYNPGNLSSAMWYCRQVSCSGEIKYSDTVQVLISSGTPDINFIRVRDILKAGVPDSSAAGALTSPYDVSQTTQYFDGLGRQLQTVAMQQSPLQKDMVSFNVYDALGRESSKYLPYTAGTNDGNYKPTALADQFNFNNTQYPGELYYYGQTSIEASPLNRPVLSMAPGTSWAGSSRGVGAQYQMNAAADSVRYWTIGFTPGALPATSATYSPGTLTKNVTTDEAGHAVVEYKDMQGKVVLKKVQLAATPGTAHVGWLCTYYIYDDLDNLRFVIQPLGVQAVNSSWTMTTAIANELCFRYEYDYRKRMIIKKIPGTGEVWMVYDARDRLVMTQDSALRLAQKWLFTKYDTENRPDSTGLITDPSNYNNRLYHQGLASSLIYYPTVSSYTNEVLTKTFYDDYGWVSTNAPALTATLANTYTTNSSYFITTYNTSPIYAVAVTPLYITRGMVTGSLTKVIGSASQYLAGVSFYDDRGRAIQSQGINYTGAVDTATTQYDFTGKPLRTLLNHKKSGNTIQNHTVLTKMDYDHGFRLRHIYKNIDNAGADQLIDSMQYNETGQLKAKYLGNTVDSLVYDYNVRGWLTGINKNYVAGTTTHYFGMELGYDKTASVAPGNTYVTPAYNGNIEGTVWKSAGSGTNRKYDFTYDNVNRLNAANFMQYNGSGFDSATVCFTTSNLTYDANGNILTMNQKGFTVGGSSLIDQLSYTYQAGSNKLSQVTDAVNNPTTLLGDFHYTGSKAGYDYTYDGNGNLKIDNNKAIDNITYNYLNLPQLVHMNTKGNITYTYDAGGNKLQKTVTDSAGSKKTITTYIAGFVYQSTSTLSGSGTDTLQFIAHEEGRARWAYHKYTTGTTAYHYEYDFFEKDHLGNTRMLLTQQRDTANYLASMEAAYRTNEQQLFGNITNTGYARASVPGYPASTTITNPNDSVSKVDYNGTTGQKSGPSLLLKVMSGDAVSIAVQSYYNTNSITTTNSSFNDVLNSLAGGIVNVTGGAHGTLANLTSSSSSIYTGLTSFLNTDDSAHAAGYPKAYLNWVFLDDQFNYISSSSGSVKAASTTYPAGTLNAVAPGAPLSITKNGYLYIWVSNETQGWDVFFDNLSVQHRQGPLLEENHYYSFGLTMAGISDKAIKTNYAENKYRFGDKELQNKEFSDGSGLEEYDFNARLLDPQLGVWHSIDPLANLNRRWSPYTYAYNNPIRYVDPDGMDGEDANGDQMVNYVDVVDKEGTVTHVITGNAEEGASESYTDLSDGEYANGAGGEGGKEEDKRNNQNLNDDKGYRNYKSIGERANFYKWVANQLSARGSTVKWASAASQIANQIDYLTKWYSKAFGYSNDELANFAEEGNAKIFLDVFGKLRTLLHGEPLTGDDAKHWDATALAQEQTLVQNLYQGLSSSSLALLSGLVKQELVGTGIVASVPAFPSTSNLLNVADRWQYGMSNMGYTVRASDMKDPGIKY